MNYVVLAGCALGGAILATCLACIPALHIYNVAGLLLVLLVRYETAVDPQVVSFLLLGMMVGYSLASVIPSVFMSVPDEATVWLVLPAQQYLLRGRGYEAIVLSLIGSLGSIVGLVVLAPVASRSLVWLRRVIQPHLAWIIGLFVTYVLVSEWPKGKGRGHTVLTRLWDGWRSLLAGQATFALSGLLGLVLTYRPLTPLRASVLGWMPVFVGLFAVPWLVANALTRTRIPAQYAGGSVDVTALEVISGIVSGIVGGLVAAVFPAITAGIGSLVAGHATAQRDERVFIVSQGAARTTYYVGALLLWYVPGLYLVRGGMSSMQSALYTPRTPREYGIAVAMVALCGAVALVVSLLLAQLVSRFISRVRYRWLSLGILAMLVIVIWLTMGGTGVLVLATASGIGMIPVSCKCRRLNCVGVLLVPALVRCAGLGTRVAHMLGLG